MGVTCRLLELLKLIPKLPCKRSTAELESLLRERNYRVTKRSVQRNLVTLKDIFSIACDENNPRGWFWLPEAEILQFPTPDPRAALTLRMAERFLSDKLPPNCLRFIEPHFRMANRLVNGPESGGLGDWAEKIEVIGRGQPLLSPSVDPQVLGVVYDALLYDRKFEATYRKRGEQATTTYSVNPLGLVFAERIVYLVCTLYDYADLDDVLFLALHRMVKAEATDTAGVKVEGFDLKKYIASGAFGFGGDGTTLKLRALFTPMAAHHLSETPLGGDQKLTPKQDGRILVEATVLDTAQLRWWLLGFGAQVEVVGPKALRKEMTETCQAMAATYRDGRGGIAS